MSDLTIKELADLKRKFEHNLASSLGTRLGNFRRATGGQVVVSDIDIRFVGLNSMLHGGIVDQAVVGVTCSLKMANGEDFKL